MHRNKTFQTNALSLYGRKSPEKELTFFPVTTTTHFWVPFSGISKQRNCFHLKRKKEKAYSQQTLKCNPYATHELTKGDGFCKPISPLIPCQTKQISVKSFCCPRGNSVHSAICFSFRIPDSLLTALYPLEQTPPTVDKHLEIWPRRPLLWTGHVSHAAEAVHSPPCGRTLCPCPLLCCGPRRLGRRVRGLPQREEGHASSPSHCNRVHGAGPAVGRRGPAWDNSASTLAKSKVLSWLCLGIVPATAHPKKGGFGK